jgi:hypothetical protein
MSRQKKQKEPVRHTHATINGIEDATANILNVISELEIAMFRAKRLLEILKTIRKSPHAYQRGKKSIRKTYIRGLDYYDEEEEHKTES